MATVTSSRPTRRVVRRSALDDAWDTALSGLTVELHPHISQYEARRAFMEAKDAIELAKIPYRLDWYRIQQAVAGL